MIIKSSDFYLRAIEESDLPLLYNLINDPDIEYSVGGWSYPVSMYSQKKWFENIHNDKNNLRLIIVTDSKSIGMVSLNDIDFKNRTASLGIKIEKNYQKYGYGSKTIIKLLKYSYYELGLNRIEAIVLENNIGSNKMFQNLKFNLDGTLVQSIYKNNEFSNQNVYSMLKKDFIQYDL